MHEFDKLLSPQLLFSASFLLSNFRNQMKKWEAETKAIQEQKIREQAQVRWPATSKQGHGGHEVISPWNSQSK